jgi:flagellar motor switch protein FliN/FliY
MAGESPAGRQDDIEELLRQAQMAAGLVNETAPTADVVQSSAHPSSTASASPAPVAAVRAERSPVAVAEPPRASAAQSHTASTVGEDIQLLIAHAQQAIASVDQPANPAVPGLAPFELKDLVGASATNEKATLELLQDVDLDLRIELGRTRMYLEDVLKLKRGSVVPLDKLAGEPVDVFVNDRMVARGEVLVLNDNFCVRVTELVTGDTCE